MNGTKGDKPNTLLHVLLIDLIMSVNKMNCLLKLSAYI